jgi:hypothetical protein
MRIVEAIRRALYPASLRSKPDHATLSAIPPAV